MINVGFAAEERGIVICNIAPKPNLQPQSTLTPRPLPVIYASAYLAFDRFPRWVGLRARKGSLLSVLVSGLDCIIRYTGLTSQAER